MTRKFQFKPSSTGDLVAVEVVNDENWYFELYHGYFHTGTVPPVIVLNSNEWVEITEKPILVTEDEYEVFDKSEQIWFVLFSEEDNEHQMIKASYSVMPNPENKTTFYHEENAQTYIKSHKPRYSNEDLEWLRTEVRCRTKETKVKHNIVECLIGRLKSSKND